MDCKLHISIWIKILIENGVTTSNCSIHILTFHQPRSNKILLDFRPYYLPSLLKDTSVKLFGHHPITYHSRSDASFSGIEVFPYQTGPTIPSLTDCLMLVRGSYEKHTITIKYLYFLNICYNYVRFQKKSDYHLLQVITDKVARPMQGDHLTNFSW